MANDRVLTFSEFSDKYSKEAGQNDAASINDLQGAADNFQQGFDETTYDKNELGPNRPVSQEYGATPAQPGEEAAPQYSEEAPEGMVAPTVDGPEIDFDEYEIGTAEPQSIDTEDQASQEAPSAQHAHQEDPQETQPQETQPQETQPQDVDFEDEGGNPEEGDEDEDEKKEEKKEEKEEKDEEKEEKKEEKEEEDEEKNESMKPKRKYKMILESFEEFEERNTSKSVKGGYDDILSTIELEDYDEDSCGCDDSDIPHDEKCFVVCKSCGAVKEIEPGHYPMGQQNVDDENSWWQGNKLGMQCGCNM